MLAAKPVHVINWYQPVFLRGLPQFQGECRDNGFSLAFLLIFRNCDNIFSG